jgi:dipeptidase D
VQTNAEDSAIQGLQPVLLWQRFYELTQIPRPSKKEERVTAHFEDLFKSLNLRYTKDKVGNLVVKVPPKRGFSKAPVVVLQGHSDMVCEKNREVAHDFDTDPIRMVRDGDWIGADGTTLGADNGIGVAAALALLSDPTAVHGPLEILITVDEETGLTGANQLSGKRLKGKYLLNLDTEETGVFCIGCAGGMDTIGWLRADTAPVPADWICLDIQVGGLKGGHSGMDIHLGRANSIKLLARTLQGLLLLGGRVAAVSGGSKRNAIPREAEARVALAADKADRAAAWIVKCREDFQAEYRVTDGGVSVVGGTAQRTDVACTVGFSKKIVNTLMAMPTGVMAMHPEIPELVETSTNLATLGMEDGQLRIGTSQRSSVESSKQAMAASVASLLRLAGARVEQTDGYPGWQPNLQSDLLEICRRVGKEQSGTAPEIKAVHAGLECGILGGKYPGMQMISFGPTITGAHSPDERVHIPAVRQFYDLLKAILKSIAQENR